MTELSDYKRLVEEPMIEKQQERERALRAEIEMLRKALVSIRDIEPGPPGFERCLQATKATAMTALSLDLGRGRR